MLKFWRLGKQPWPAACAVPHKTGIAKDAHIIRVSPCLGERYNHCVFCAVVKITEGDNATTGEPLVEGWGDITEATSPISATAIWKKDGDTLHLAEIFRKFCVDYPTFGRCGQR